jgi:signal transduction histidine kinase/ligand-binding sensor domain-containing protein
MKTILSVFLVTVSFAQQTEYLLQQWKVEDGLPQSTVRCIAQTRDGYLWVGTWQGLARFDGLRMTVFKSSNTPALYSSNIMSLFADQRGHLWVGTDAGGLVRYAEGTFTRFDSADGCSAKRILAITQDRSGRMWFATEQGIFSYDGARFLRFTKADGLPYTYANQVLPLPDGSIYLGFVGYGTIARLIGDSLRVDETFSVGGYLVAADAEGTIWYGDRSKGFVRRKNGAESVDSKYAGVKPGETYMMRNGEKWLLTSEGIVTFSNERVGAMKEISGLSMTDVTTLFEDREGNLWLGKEGSGLIMLRKKNVTVRAVQNGFPSDLIMSGMEDRSGTQWIGTWDAGLLKIGPGTEATAERIRLGRNVISVNTLHQSHDGAVWAGSWGYGLFRLKNGRTERIIREIVDTVTSIITIAQDRNGDMWVGTAHEGVLQFNDSVSTVWNSAAGLSGNRINAVLAARNGDVWISVSGNGVNRISNGVLTVHKQGSGLNDNFASPLYEDTEGAVWIGTSRGLTRWKNGRFSYVTEEQGLVDGIIAQIIQDAAGNFWIGAIHGIYRVSAQELNDAADGKIRSVTCFTVGKEDGMLNEETGAGGTPRCWKSADGILSFSTSQGIVQIDPRRVSSNPVPPDVSVEAAWVENEPVPVNRAVVLAPGETKLELQYTGINFTAPKKIRFRYRLEGFETEWNEAGTKRSVQYTNLDPGEYTFRVIGENSAGIVSVQEAALPVIVLPPFYRTWWFRSIAVLFFLTIGPSIYFFRVRQLTAEKERQVEFSRRLIESQESERKRIASELHDGLGQNLLIIKNKLLVALQSLQSGTVSTQQVAEASEIASGTIEEVRSISHNLRPHQLDHLGLTKTLRSVVRQTKESTGIEITAVIGDIDGLLTPEEEISLFRIFQESFNNIIKHAEATVVRAEVHRRERTIEILIEDNGKGITQAGGFGISGMHERASMFSWSLSITPRQPNGTAVSLTIPVRS